MYIYIYIKFSVSLHVLNICKFHSFFFILSRVNSQIRQNAKSILFTLLHYIL